ncbi:MAG TPA: hypothetical protein VGG07_14230 [Solirubrobacteraceae bacterium]|jgi:transcriptional regulator with XRE-family HTH domain
MLRAEREAAHVRVEDVARMMDVSHVRVIGIERTPAVRPPTAERYRRAVAAVRVATAAARQALLEHLNNEALSRR